MSTLHASNPAGSAGSINRSAYSSHLNLIWSPVEKANLGPEYIRAGRTVESGDSGRLNRLQASAQLLF